MKSKRKLIVHVGAPKAGTTTIQTALDLNTLNLASSGWIYPKYGRAKVGAAAHHNFAYKCDPKLGGESRFDPASCLLREVGASDASNFTDILMPLCGQIIFPTQEFPICLRSTVKWRYGAE